MTITLPALPSPTNVDLAEKSAETKKFLRENVKVGYTTQRGPAWWANGTLKDGTWTSIPDGSHFPGPVPISAVRKTLDVKLVKGTVYVEYIDAKGNKQVIKDSDVGPIVNATSGQVFSYPTAKYAIHPYLKTLHGFIEQILDDPSVGVGSVGLLKKGGVAFLQAVLPESFEVAGYGYQPYVTAVTSANLSRSSSFGTGAKGAVCDNTLDEAVKGFLTSMKIRHTLNSGFAVQAAREKLGIRLVQVAETIGDTIEGLTKIDVTERQFARWMDLSVPLLDADGEKKTGAALTVADKKRDELTRLWMKDPKVAPWAGTAFGVLQLDNTYRTWNGQVQANQGGRFEKNLTSDVMGLTAKGDMKSLELLGKVLRKKTLIAA